MKLESFVVGVDDTYFTVYTPMYASMTRTPYNFSKGVDHFLILPGMQHLGI